MSDELREQLADVQHAIWGHWMGYMFSCGWTDWNGCWIMPADKYQRWARQMVTPYAELTEKERMSDREQADKILAVIAPVLEDAEAVRFMEIQQRLAATRLNVELAAELAAELGAGLISEAWCHR